MSVCVHGGNLCVSYSLARAEHVDYICYFAICFIPHHTTCMCGIWCTLYSTDFIGRRVLMTLCFVYIPSRDHNICMTSIIIIAKNASRFHSDFNWQSFLSKLVQPCTPSSAIQIEFDLNEPKTNVTRRRLIIWYSMNDFD